MRLNLGLVLLLVIIGLIGYLFFVPDELRFQVVREGVLYRSGQPTVGDLERLYPNYPFNTILNLRYVGKHGRTTWYRDEEGFAADKGIVVKNIPIAGRIPSQEQVEEFLALVDDPDKHPILLHCNHGIDRTGVMVAVFRMEYDGWSSEEALQEYLKARPVPRQKRVEFILNYKPRWALEGPE